MKWNTVERTTKTETGTRTESKEVGKLGWLFRRHKPQHPHHVKLSPRGQLNQNQLSADSNNRQYTCECGVYWHCKHCNQFISIKASRVSGEEDRWCSSIRHKTRVTDRHFDSLTVLFYALTDLVKIHDKDVHNEAIDDDTDEEKEEKDHSVRRRRRKKKGGGEKLRHKTEEKGDGDWLRRRKENKWRHNLSDLRRP